jgi:hypothetical protein
MRIPPAQVIRLEELRHTDHASDKSMPLFGGPQFLLAAEALLVNRMAA